MKHVLIAGLVILAIAAVALIGVIAAHDPEYQAASQAVWRDPSARNQLQIY